MRVLVRPHKLWQSATMAYQRLPLILLTCTSLILPAQAWADDISIRTGTHPTYSRLVFDWPKKTSYTVEKQSDTQLKITFDKASGLNTEKAQSKPVANIYGLNILGEDPLSLTIKIPESSRVRDFTAGNKVIIDVYNPTTPSEKASTFNVSRAASDSEKKQETTSQKTSQIKPIKPKADQSVPPPQGQLVKPQTNRPASKNTLETSPEKDQVIRAKAQSSMITISSTQGFGLAAFENAGNLWLVNDKKDILLTPQISGPDAQSLDRLEDHPNEDAKIFFVPMLEDAKAKGDGGGVLWRLMLGSDLSLNEPIEPVRSNVDSDEPRSGKIMWPLDSAHKVIEMTDPFTGEDIFVVTVEDADDFAGPARSFIDFNILPTSIGLAVVPKSDNIEVKVVRGGVEISKPEGLSLSSQASVESALRAREVEELRAQKQDDLYGGDDLRIFDFASWQLGGEKVLNENHNVILADLSEMEDELKVESLLTLAKMYLSNGFGPEALGALEFAAQELPSLAVTPEFLSLKGAAEALSGHYEDAFQNLSNPALKPFNEVQMWRAIVLAALGDWQQAAAVAPQNINAIYDYPERIRHFIALDLAEIALRNGEVDRATTLLQLVEQNEKSLISEHKAAFKYLKGEAARQGDDSENAVLYWDDLAKGSDEYYRVRAKLAKTILQKEEGSLSHGQIIDNLERLRYSWRGDELEAQVNFWLGKSYFDKGEFVKGLKIMREAASFVPNTNLSQRIAEDMQRVFAGLYFSPDKLEGTTPLDAIALYDQFTELVPLGDDGTRLVKILAEYMTQADMFNRAGELLASQLPRLDGMKAVEVGSRLAAIRLLDKNPDLANEALNITQTKLQELPEELQTPERYHELPLLRARTLSLQGRPDQALALLERLNREADTNRLRADIAWQASYWDDAAEALGDVIIDRNISLTRPLEDEETQLLLQRAVALNLASDRVALANMREKYSDLMSQTGKAKVFEVITRPRQNATLADRETLLSVASEVDLFSDFLDAYKSEIN